MMLSGSPCDIRGRYSNIRQPGVSPEPQLQVGTTASTLIRRRVVGDKSRCPVAPPSEIARVVVQKCGFRGENTSSKAWETQWAADSYCTINGLRWSDPTGPARDTGRRGSLTPEVLTK